MHGAFAYFKDADHLVAINAVRATPSGRPSYGCHPLEGGLKNRRG